MKQLCLLILLFVVLSISAQQDPQYSQYLFNRSILNPAYNASREVTFINAQVRKQWVGLRGSPQTNNLTFAAPLGKRNLAVGARLTAESIGPKRWLSAYTDLAYRIKLRVGQLCFGLSAGAVGYDFSAHTIDLYDPNEPALNTNGQYRALAFDAGAGCYFFTRSFYVGLSSTHLTAPALFEGANNSTFYDLRRHYFFNIGKGMRLTDQLVFNPSLLVRYVEDGRMNADLSLCLLMYNAVSAGISVRSSSALVAFVQCYVSDQLRIGYSYDYGLKGIARSTAGSHELTLHLDLVTKRSKITTTRLL